MKKILPYTEPIFTTFHCSAITEIAGNGSKQINNWMMNKYLRWRSIMDFTKNFNHIITISDSMIWNITIFESKRLNKEQASNNIHEIISGLINKDYYIFLAGIDDYYITGKNNYLKKHFAHDGIILGYDDSDNTYEMAAYKLNQQFGRFSFPQADLENSINSTYIPDSLIILGLKAPKNNHIELDVTGIKKLFAEYLFPEKYAITPNDGFAYGLNVYSHLQKYITLIETRELLDTLDNRAFSLLNEHKRFVLKLLSYLCLELKITSAAPHLYEKIVNQSEILRLLSLKYNVTKNKIILVKMNKKISIIREEERKILSDFIGLL